VLAWRHIVVVVFDAAWQLEYDPYRDNNGTPVEE